MQLLERECNRSCYQEIERLDEDCSDQDVRDAEWIVSSLVPVAIMLVRRGHLPDRIEEQQERRDEPARQHHHVSPPPPPCARVRMLESH